MPSLLIANWKVKEKCRGCHSCSKILAGRPFGEMEMVLWTAISPLFLLCSNKICHKNTYMQYGIDYHVLCMGNQSFLSITFILFHNIMSLDSVGISPTFRQFTCVSEQCKALSSVCSYNSVSSGITAKTKTKTPPFRDQHKLVHIKGCTLVPDMRLKYMWVFYLVKQFLAIWGRC